MRKMSLDNTKLGDLIIVKKILNESPIKRRLLDIGLTPGTQIERILENYGKDLVAYMIRGALIAIRNEDAKNIIKYLYNKYQDNIIISIMNQYTPVKEFKYSELNRKVTDEEYNELIEYAYDLGVRNAFVQEDGTASESFIPKFDKEGV